MARAAPPQLRAQPEQLESLHQPHHPARLGPLPCIFHQALLHLGNLHFLPHEDKALQLVGRCRQTGRKPALPASRDDLKAPGLATHPGSSLGADRGLRSSPQSIPKLRRF